MKHEDYSLKCQLTVTLMMHDEQDEPTTSDDSDMEMPWIIFEDDDSGGHTHCNCHRKCDAMDLGNICRLCLPQSAKHSEKDHKESVFQAVKAVVHAKENEGVEHNGV